MTMAVMNSRSFLRKRGEVSHGRRQATRRTPRLLAALIALFVLGLAASSGTKAAVGTTFTVDSTGDTADANVGDGVCADPAGNCTLRAAIAESNASADSRDTIAFTGTLSIALESDLPAITDPVDIDGTTQPGCAGSPIVEVRATGSQNGLVLNAGDSTVCGLVLNRLFDAIQVSSSDNRIEGNFIGTDVAGAAALANGHVGINVFSGARNHVDRNVISGNGNGLEILAFSSGNVIQGNHFGTNATGTAALPNGLDLSINSDNDTIGGTLAEATRNIFAGRVFIGEPSTGALVQGNYFGTDETGGSALEPGGPPVDIQGAHVTIGGSEGVTLGGPCTGACNVFANGLILSAPVGEAGNHVVQGNFVGTDFSGMRALGGGSGVKLADTTDNLIGGTDPAERNLISGNALMGVLIANTSFRNRIVGNLIGTDASGTGPLPNGIEGVLCCGSGQGDDNTIERNVIAFNGCRGIAIVGAGQEGTVGNAILGNSVFANGCLGIDLGPPGVTENDAGDTDTGSNDLQNFPVITRVTVDGGETTIEGTLNSVPDSTYHVELFRNSGCDSSHFGEGETFLGSTSVPTGPGGDGSFTVTYPVALGPTEVVTSTATDARNNTSEFSECLADLSITKSDDPDPVAVGTRLTYTIDVANDGPAPASAVRVIDTLPSDVTVTSITSSQGSCDESTVTCTLGSIGRGGTARVTIVVDPGSTPRTLTNTAAVSSELRDPDESDNSATATTQVVAERPATIIVRKVTVPSPDPTDTSFAFTAGGGLSPASFSLKNDESRTFADLVPQAGYTVAETTPAGWDSTGICSDGSPVSNIEVGPGETVTCAFTNRRRGTIIVRKATVPSPDPTDTSFAFTAGGGLSPASFGLKNGQSQTFADLVPQAGYSVAETTPAGWDSTSACSDGSPISNIDVGPGETVTCTFTNTRRGLARVVKTVTGRAPSGSESFTFQLRQGASPTSSGTMLESQNASAANGGFINFATTLVPATTYALCEVLPSGWTTTLGPPLSVYNPAGDNSTLCTDFTVQPGETKTFTIDNRRQAATLIVRKVTEPANAATAFSFSAGGGLTPTSFTLTGGSSRTFANISPGSGYSLAESVPAGWELQGATCSDGSPVTNISLDSGETVTCTFTNAVLFAPGGGLFVIGDRNAAIGTKVTFWGAQWWQLNSLSGGTGPAAFKGFAKNPGRRPSCGTDWSTDPGNSAPPPPGPLPAHMGVIASSSIRKSGSTISGNTVRIVIVKTNPGYSPNPGHAGTGTVVATVC
jgi:uncharacterized repeat protein (TIGR01451 family)/CSLREA domain-containing protein